MQAGDADLSKSAGTEALSQTAGCVAGLVREVTVAGDGGHGTLSIEGDHPQFPTRLERVSGGGQEADELVFVEMLDDVLRMQEIERSGVGFEEGDDVFFDPFAVGIVFPGNREVGGRKIDAGELGEAFGRHPRHPLAFATAEIDDAGTAVRRQVSVGRLVLIVLHAGIQRLLTFEGGGIIAIEDVAIIAHAASWCWMNVAHCAATASWV